MIATNVVSREEEARRDGRNRELFSRSSLGGLTRRKGGRGFGRGSYLGKRPAALERRLLRVLVVFRQPAELTRFRCAVLMYVTLIA